ncbi:MAG: glutamate--tRNA ligase [Holosporales bacterium]|jgi:glutamyl-tRNA synthetase|nr:glutamate--tRNA ligase [Holosporales bacterium]
MGEWVRFAPSPTGLLHVGNARAALLNYLYARQKGARFLLRIDDTDTERSQPAFVEAIQNDLTWLGISWDAIAFQSAHLQQYALAAERLRAMGRLYPCYETPEELAFQRKSLLAQGKPPIYNRAALALSEKEHQSLENTGRKPHWRFRLSEERVNWEDGIHGMMVFEGTYASDPVLVREDGLPVYTLASVVDDLEFGISCVIRGADHMTNTAVQIQLLEALEKNSASRISWAHYPLFRMRSGEELSKRLGGMSLQMLRNNGIHPLALCSFLAKLGTSDALEACLSLDALRQDFDFSKISLAEAQFDPQELNRLNRHLLSMLPFGEVNIDLQKAGIFISTEFWKAVRGNINTLLDVCHWQEVCFGTIESSAGAQQEDPAFFRACILCLERASEKFGTEKMWEDFIKDLTQSTGRNGRNLFHPLRLILTGQETGPELRVLASFMGRTRMMQRVQKYL